MDKKIYNKWDWSERYPSQPEIQKYLKFVAKEFNLFENISFSSDVSKMRFNDETNNWKISLSNGKTLYEHNRKSINPKHDHILCEDCGEIFEFFDHNISAIEDKIAKKLNIRVTKRIHQISGTCNNSNCSHSNT